MLERGLEPLHFYKTLEPKPSVYTSFTTPTRIKLLLHFKGVEPLALSLENQYSAIWVKNAGLNWKDLNLRMPVSKTDALTILATIQETLLKEKGFEPLKELFSSRFTVYRLWPLSHSFNTSIIRQHNWSLLNTAGTLLIPDYISKNKKLSTAFSSLNFLKRYGFRVKKETSKV